LDVRVGVGGREHRMHPMPGGRRRDQPGAEGAADRDVERRRAHTHAPRELSVVVGGGGHPQHRQHLCAAASDSACSHGWYRPSTLQVEHGEYKSGQSNVAAEYKGGHSNIKAGMLRGAGPQAEGEGRTRTKRTEERTVSGGGIRGLLPPRVGQSAGGWGHVRWRRPSRQAGRRKEARTEGRKGGGDSATRRGWPQTRPRASRSPSAAARSVRACVLRSRGSMCRPTAPRAGRGLPAHPPCSHALHFPLSDLFYLPTRLLPTG